MRPIIEMKTLLMLMIMMITKCSQKERGTRSERVCVQSDKQCKPQRRSNQKVKGFVIDLKREKHIPKSKPKSMRKPLERRQASRTRTQPSSLMIPLSLKGMHTCTAKASAQKAPKGVREPFASRKKRINASTQNEQTKQGIKQHDDDKKLIE